MPVRLKSLDTETLEAPISRIGSASQAQQFVESLIYDDDTRVERETKMDGLLDGNPPWTRKTLQEKGQGHRVNLNLREGEGMLDAAKTPYYDLIFEVPRVANITFDLAEIAEELNTEWGEIASDEYDRLLDNWIGFDENIQLSQWNMCKVGVGPMFFSHQVSWQPMAIRRGRMLVPMRTKANVEEFEAVVILWSIRPDKLSQIVRSAGDSKGKIGWNEKIALKEIAKVDKGGVETRGHGSRAERYQQAMRHGDLFYAVNQSEDVRLASLFIRNFEGSIDHFIIGRSPEPEELAENWDGQTADDVEIGYLYRRKAEYDDFSQIVVPFFFDTGPDGEMHSIKGLGPKIYDFCDVRNRMMCQMIDGAVIGSGLVLEAQDASSYEESQIHLLGGAAIVRHGSKVAQTRIAESLQGALGVTKALADIMQTNTGTYRQPAAMEQHAPTYGQEQMYAQMRGALTKGAVTRYYKQFDCLHREIVRRLLDTRQTEKIPGGKEALAFKEACVRRGIPDGALKWEHIKSVKSVRAIGYGSPQIRDIATKELLSLAPSMDEQSRNNALRARAAAIPGVGQAMVDQYFPSLKKKKMPGDHLWEATLENGVLRQLDGGRYATVQDRQNHKVHFMTHFSDAMFHSQQMQAGRARPHELLIHLDEAGPHLKQHLDKMPQFEKLAALYSGRGQQQSRKQDEEHKGFSKALQSLSQMTDRLHKEIDRSNAEAQAGNGQEQAKSPGLDPELMAELTKIHGELDLKREKQHGLLSLRAEDQEFKHRLKDADLAAKIHREQRKSLLAEVA